MTLVPSNTIIDEELRTTQTGTSDDNDSTAAVYTASTFSGEVSAVITADSLTLMTSPTGFPQYARKTDFVTSTNTVTDLTLSVDAGGVATPLFIGSDQIFLYATSNPDIIIGRLGNGGTADPNGEVALIIGVEDPVSSGDVLPANMWIGLYGPVVHSGTNLVDSADQLSLTGLIDLVSSFTVSEPVPFENFNGVPSGNNLFNVIFPSAGDKSIVQLLLTGSDDNGDLSTVNVSTTGVGAGSQHINVGYTLRIDTVQGMTQTEVDSAPEVNMASHIVYSDTADSGTDARVESIGADFEITQLNPGSSPERVDIKISAYNVAGEDQGQTYLNNIDSNGTAVDIDPAAVIVKNGAGQVVNGLTIIEDPNDPNSVIIRGLDDGTNGSKTDGWQVFFTTNSVGFDRLLITNVDASTTFDVGNFHFTTLGTSTATESVDVGANLIFQDDGPMIGTVPDGTAPSSPTGVDATTGIGSFTANAGADVTTGGFVTIYDWAEITGLTSSLNSDGTVLTYSSNGTPIYRLTVDNDSYDFDVLGSVAGPVEPLAFGALKSGGPQETLSVPTVSGSHNVVFDGLFFTGIAGANGSALGSAFTNFAPADLNSGPADNLNPDNVGFGVKNGQASQINHNEGFFFSVPGQEQLSLSFDVAGIGNLDSINIEYWVFDSNDQLINYVSDTVDNLSSDNQTVTISDDGGLEFETAYIRFYFADQNTNSGVRIIDFASQVAGEVPDREIEFQLLATDSEGDTAISNIYSVLVDNPNYTGTADLFGIV